MGRHQKAEASGLISFVLCAVIGGFGMYWYMQAASAFWQISQRRFMACAAIVAACGVGSFIAGYLRREGRNTLQHAFTFHIRRIFEVLALSVVYAATLFLTSYMLFNIMNGAMGKAFSTYIPAICAAFAGISGYLTFVQAELMDAKTLASLLPFFIISGVGTASFTSNDPYWFNNNFSQLGDRTTFAARMFNSTLILGGICIIIISYFAISELIATYHVRDLDGKIQMRNPKFSYRVPQFKARITALTILLILSGVCFIGIGTFRYTPHPILHNVFARGMPVIMFIMLVALPWLAPQLSRAFFVISDMAIVVCAIEGVMWLLGRNTLTNVEALAAMLFLGWFIVFSRQIAAIEADRIQQQLLLRQTVPFDDSQNEAADVASEHTFQTVLDNEATVATNTAETGTQTGTSKE
ncbi:ABC transporter permease [Bifidobacterium canis]|uniref:ABC transporter permease n=1 Tax=Bifidobacterium canis TaxID=2610880 RepID=A0A7K1J3A0_9BIFI|nr:ABC transporter permease [Bifidobacterium canis]MUH59032.1 ABC transporter permease [Bifidobacterium canis]